LNLRAIARDLGIAAPSIYNYFPSRDNLVTTLIADAYNSLAESQEAALESGLAESLSTKLFLLGIAYRDWVVTFPQRYQLIFGTPIPHYHAPDDVTVPAATRALVPLIKVIQDLQRANALRTERFSVMSPRLESMLRSWQEAEGSSDIETLYLAIVIWSRLHGLVGLEIGNQFPPFIDAAEIFQREMNNILIQYL
ncbi:MAG: TetR family transcriptional regulator, partial [Anaerolineae bacterium]|nr:TetR family transcriptional regulator [Anaerolineae bacterium]